MSKTLSLLLSCVLLGCPPLFAQEVDDGPRPPHRQQESEAKAARQARWLSLAKAPTTGQERWDARFYHLQIALDPVALRVDGRLLLRGSVLEGPLDDVELDLDDALSVSLARAAGMPQTPLHVGELLTVPLDRSYLTGEDFEVEIVYGGVPDFSRGAIGFDSQDGEPLLWTLSEPFGARTWWPCKDTPSDKADSVAIDLTLPSDLIGVSNGTLVGTQVQGPNTVWSWRERYPITTYLVSIAAHPYVVQTVDYAPLAGASMPVTVYSYAGQAGSAWTAANLTVDMLGAFAGMFGEYPFLDEKYGQAQFPWGGGMEHQTATSLCCWNEGLIAHELAHQWYGDAITCRSFEHIWVNEGFATYAEALWDENQDGSSALHAHMANNEFLGAGTIYVPSDRLDDFGRVFDGNLSYDKASWVLHMLRGVVGDATFFDILRAYTASPTLGYGVATTEDFQAVAEAVSGRDLSGFFSSWIYEPFFPTYGYDWSASENAGQWELMLQLDQLQGHALYDLPMTVRVETVAGSEDHRVEAGQATQVHALAVGAEPLSIELDPERWILKTVEHPLDAVSFHRGVLLVNGVDWISYGGEISTAYADSAFSGRHPFEFWDLFAPPPGGYVGALPPPLGSGPVPGAILGEFSTVIWVGNDYLGDRELWSEAPIRAYLEKGGNVLLLGRMGQNFLTPTRAERLGIRWAERAFNTIGDANAAHPAFVSMARTGTQSWVSVFETGFDQPESVLLLTENTAFGVARGLGVWRRPPGGGSLRASGGHFAHLAGRPYRWSHAALRANVASVLEELFEEPFQPVAAPTPSRARTTLHAPFPNPFNPRVELRFTLAAAGRARLEIFDLRGRHVATVLDEERPAGEGRALWEGRDDAGASVASGVYTALLAADGERRWRKLTLLR